MKNHTTKLLLVILPLFVCSSQVTAQKDTMKAASQKYMDTYTICFKYINESNWDSALTYARELQVMCDSEVGTTNERYASGAHLIGELLRLMEKYKESLPYFLQSDSIFERIYLRVVFPLMYPASLERTAYIYFQLGAIDNAEKFYLKAIEVNHILNASGSDNMEVFQLLASIYLRKGEYAKADSLYELTQFTLDTLPVNGGRLYLKASVYGNRATLFSETGDYVKTLQYLKKALPLEKQAKDSGWLDNDYVQICLNLAEAYALNGNMDSAWKYCRRAEDSLTDLHHNALLAQITKQQASLYQRQLNYRKAIVLNEKFITMADTLPGVADDYYSVLVNLGTLYTAVAQYEKADSLFRKIIFKLEDSGLVYSYPLIQAKKGLCINLVRQRKYTEATHSLLTLIRLDFDAMNKNFEAMPEAEKLRYQAEADKIFDLMYICVRNDKSITPKIIYELYRDELERKGLILRSQLNKMQAIRNSNDTALISLYAQWLNNRQVLSRQYSLPYKQRMFNIDSLEEVNEIVEKKLAAKSSYVAAVNKNVLPSSLIPDSLNAAIEFVRYDYRSLSVSADSAFYAAFICTASDTIPQLIHLCNEQQLIHLMKNKRDEWINENQLTGSLYDRNKYGSLLYRLIWKKIDAHLGGIKYVNYSTAGILNNISYPAIYNGKQYLINHYIFKHYFSLLQFYTTGGAFKIPGQINIWGNINYNNAAYDSANSDVLSSSISQDVGPGSLLKDISAKPLQPLNIGEVENLKKIFYAANTPVYSYENRVATEDNFKQRSSAISGILHVSTHGFYIPLNKSNIKSNQPAGYISGLVNPLFRCGLAFAGVNYYWLKGKPRSNRDDGILTGYEVAELDLHNVQLVTLSACETGLGDVTYNEGDIGLQRAFKIAGVQNMIVSLWQVPAKQTAELFTSFYSYLQKGQSLDDAFRLAQLAMEKKYTPYFWAGFMLIK